MTQLPLATLDLEKTRGQMKTSEAKTATEVLAIAQPMASHGMVVLAEVKGPDQ